MGYWENKRNELIEKLPTIMDVLDRLSYGEEKWALDKSPFRLLFPSYAQDGLFEIVPGPEDKDRLIPCSLSFNCYYRKLSFLSEIKEPVACFRLLYFVRYFFVICLLSVHCLIL